MIAQRKLVDSLFGPAAQRRPDAGLDEASEGDAPAPPPNRTGVEVHPFSRPDNTVPDRAPQRLAAEPRGGEWHAGPAKPSFVADSPRMIAQRMLLDSLFGPAAQLRVGAGLDKASEGDAPAPSPNRTGMPDPLKHGIESLSGFSMDSVRVHYNSAQPVQLNALAYGQGHDIHLASGQEHHLAHEACHVVQQQQGRVSPTLHVGGRPVSDDAGLEQDADAMGACAAQFKGTAPDAPRATQGSGTGGVIQAMTGYEVELQEPIYTTPAGARLPRVLKRPAQVTPAINAFLGGGLQYGRKYGTDPCDYFELTADHGSFSKLHSDLIEALKEDGYIHPDWTYVAMSDMEYITPPIEERDPAAITRTKQIADAVQDHVTATEVEAKKDGALPVPDPAIDLLTGVPKSDLDTWILATDAKSRAALAAVKAYVGFVYHQQTSGTLPSEVPALFAEAKKDITSGTLPDTHKEVVAHLLDESVRVAAEALAECELCLLFDVANTAPLKGWLTLVAQYLLSNKLEATTFLPDGSTPKNLVPYLSKMSITDSVQALPADSRPYVADASALTDKDEVWIKIFLALLSKSNAIDVMTWSAGLAARVSPKKFLAAGDPAAFLNSILQGRSAGETSTGHPLRLDAGQEALKPKLKIDGEQAIPLEDRFASYKSAAARDPAQISATLMKDFDKVFVRRHASAGEDVETQRALAEAFEAARIGEEAVTPLQKLGDFEAKLRKRATVCASLYGVDATRFLIQIDTEVAKIRLALQPAATDLSKGEGKASAQTLFTAYERLHAKIREIRKAENEAVVATAPRLTDEGYV